MRMSTFAAAALPMAVFANRLAPLSRSPSHIAGEYIVMLHGSSNVFAEDGAIKILKEEPRYTWTTALKGFSATMDAQTLEAMRQHPDVESVTENGITRAAGWSDADGPPANVLASMGETGQSPNPNPTNNIANDWLKQEKPTWGLARVSSKAPKGTSYEYHKSQGEGVCAWIVDTGVAAEIEDFEGRAENVHNVIKGEKNTDLNNHGTHCAGTVASKTYGVAKKAFIRSIKVLGAGASGPDDGVVEAINWLAENGPKRTECKNGHVVNMSFTADKIHAPMKAACAKLVELGMHVAVASGNGNRDASKDSPGDEPTVCNVAATDKADGKASFSNHGKGIDINAPGDQIDSWHKNGKASGMSGTSMAAPHIAGLGAVLMTEKGNLKGKAVCDELIKMAHKDVLKKLTGETPNLLSFNGNPNAK